MNNAHLNPRSAMNGIIKVANVYCPDGNTNDRDDLHTAITDM